ncbi:MAG TPA: hypothetical protein VD902_12470 [Symbiobacteriaceae bacterium]|nr:hypothetical protein [Symbiobacteriaceae bacterium]
MQGRNSYEDELARRRALRDLKNTEPAAEKPPGDTEEEMPKFGWSDIFAMTIAAYQVLFPMLLIMVGAMVGGYLIFRFVFR